MKKSLKKLALGSFAIGALMLTSCEDDPILGCMDSAASNYNAEATESDDNCTYSTSYYLTSNEWEYVSVNSGSAFIDSTVNAEFQGFKLNFKSNGTIDLTEGTEVSTSNWTLQDNDEFVEIVDTEDNETTIIKIVSLTSSEFVAGFSGLQGYSTEITFN